MMAREDEGVAALDVAAIAGVVLGCAALLWWFL